MTSNKTRTVRRGEIGLSQWAIRRGYTHGATNDVKDLDAILNGLSDERLVRAVRNLIIPEDRKLSEIKSRMLQSGHNSRGDMINLILTTVARQGSSYALQDFSINDQGHSFLKKTPVYLDKDASDVTIRIAEGFPGPAGLTILNEALALRAQRAPQFDQKVSSRKVS